MADGPKERAERCETCRFRNSRLALDGGGRWKPLGTPPGERLTEAEYEEGGEESGECRRFPPAAPDGRFPLVYLDDWCGEWRPRGG